MTPPIPDGPRMLGRLLAGLLLVGGCRTEPPPATDGRDRTASPSPTASVPRPSGGVTSPGPANIAADPGADPMPMPTRFPEPARLVAIGDVHGDLAATRRALRLAGAIDESDQWVGGSLVVVQTGDQLDRGDDEQAILDLFERLRVDAAAAGGAFHALNGNHELMNVAGDLRYVTDGGFTDFEGIEGLDLADPALSRLPPQARARAAAFRPNGPYARILAHRNTVVVVGASVFVHGGVLPQHVPQGLADLERLNADVRSWLVGRGDPGRLEGPVLGEQGVVWTRVYASDDAEACALLAEALERLEARRMVVGHTVQEGGITSACHDQLWRIDVGMAAHYGGPTQVLAIEGSRVTPLRAEG